MTREDTNTQYFNYMCEVKVMLAKIEFTNHNLCVFLYKSECSGA